MGGRGAIKSEKWANVVYEWPLINSFSLFQVPGVQSNMMTQKKICIALHMPLTLPFIIWYSIGFSYLWLVVVEWWPVVARRLQKCHHLKEKENKKSATYFAKTMSFSSSKITEFLKNKISCQYWSQMQAKFKSNRIVQVKNKRQLTNKNMIFCDFVILSSFFWVLDELNCTKNLKYKAEELIWFCNDCKKT